jgi:hypothetical protein
MIFTKEFLADSLDRRYKQTLHASHPYKTHFTGEEKSPAEILVTNYFTFFDKKSDEMKDLMLQARKEIAENCFKDDVMDVYPNSLKIDQCIKNIEVNYLGKHYNKRNIFFGNSKNI